ncbi:hypothetical protein D3C71_1816250 [compost metagenome]
MRVEVRLDAGVAVRVQGRQVARLARICRGVRTAGGGAGDAQAQLGAGLFRDADHVDAGQEVAAFLDAGFQSLLHRRIDAELLGSVRDAVERGLLTQIGGEKFAGEVTHGSGDPVW